MKLLFCTNSSNSDSNSLSLFISSVDFTSSIDETKLDFYITFAPKLPPFPPFYHKPHISIWGMQLIVSVLSVSLL